MSLLLGRSCPASPRPPIDQELVDVDGQQCKDDEAENYIEASAFLKLGKSVDKSGISVLQLLQLILGRRFVLIVARMYVHLPNVIQSNYPK